MKDTIKVKVETTENGRKYIILPEELSGKLILVFPIYEEVQDNNGLQDTNN